MRTTLVLAVVFASSGSIAYAGREQVDALTECVQPSADGRYTYSYIVNECPTIATVEMECAVLDNQRKTVARSQQTYEPDMDAKPRWNRRCVVVDESGKHVFTRGEKTFSVTRASSAAPALSAQPVTVVENAPCSHRAHEGRPRRLASLSISKAWR